MTTFHTKEILRVLTGSRAHLTHREDSDWDYRGVYVSATRDLVCPNFTLNDKGRVHTAQPKGTSWIEGQEVDSTTWEVGNYLKLAVQSNPTILEVLVSPMVNFTEWGRCLRELFPHVWSSDRVYLAFGGYAHNQRKKLLDHKLDEDEDFRLTARRRMKFAVAWLRVLTQGITLLKTGVLPVPLPEHEREKITEVQNGRWTVGQIVDWGRDLLDEMAAARKQCDKRVDPEPINGFMADIRQAHWTTQGDGDA